MGAVLMLLFTVILPDYCTTGIDACDTSAFCTDTDGGFECTCDMGYSGDGFTCAGLLSINIHNLHTAPKVGNWLISHILFLILHCMCVVLNVTQMLSSIH